MTASDSNKVLVLGTAPNAVICEYLENGLEQGVEAYLLVKSGRKSEFASTGVTVGSYGREFKYHSGSISRKLKAMNPDRVVILSSRGFAHHHIAKALTQYKHRYGFSWQIMYSVDGEPAQTLKHGMDEGCQFSDRAPWWLMVGGVALWLCVASCAYFLLGSYGFAGVVAATMLAEVVLRLKGGMETGVTLNEGALPGLKVDGKGALQVQDSELGWRSAESARIEYTYTLVDGGGSLRFVMNTDEEGRRVTRERQESHEDKPEIVILGGSQSFGWGVEDKDVFSWRLQERFSEYQVNNYSIPRSSLYQQLLLLDRKLKNSRPRLVVLCLSSAVLNWNTGEFKDMVALRKMARPTCLSKEKKLKRFEPTTYKYIPKSDSIRLVKLVERVWNRIRFAGRDDAHLKLRTFEHLLLQMRRTCEKNGSELLVACTNDCSDHYAFFKKCGFSWVLAGIDYSDDSLTLRPYDGHPNAKGQEHFYEVIAAACEDMLKGRVVEPEVVQGLNVGSVTAASRGETEDIYPLF